MPGTTPLLNAVFYSAPDFNNQSFTGATGNTVRSFGYLAPGIDTYTVNDSSQLWKIIELQNNAVVTLSPIAGANPGDEIILFSPSGTVTTSAAGTTINNPLISSNPGRPLRLIYLGSDTWQISSSNVIYSSFNITNCCGSNSDVIYQLSPSGGIPDLNKYAYASPGGINPFTGDNGGITGAPPVYIYAGDTASAFTFTSGIGATATCELVSYTTPYTFYNPFAQTVQIYSESGIDIYNNSVIVNYRFKTQSDYLYACDTSWDVATAGEYLYRFLGAYGVESPVIFTGGFASIPTPPP